MTTRNQKICRTIAFAFSIVELIGCAIMAVVCFVEYAQVKDILNQTGVNVPEIDTVYLPMAIVLLVIAVASLIFVIFNAKARKDEYSHIALGVLQIIFGNIISGILILVSGGENKPHKPQ